MWNELFNSYSVYVIHFACGKLSSMGKYCSGCGAVSFQSYSVDILHFACCNVNTTGHKWISECTIIIL